MKSYFILTGQTERDVWDEYRVEWLEHREAVLAFMNKVGGVEVRTNHFGAPVAVRFEKGVELPEGFRKTEWGSSGAHLINMKGEKLFHEDTDRVRAMFPKFPEHIPRSGFFDLEVVWRNEASPIYILAQHGVANFMRGYGGYREITENEFNFRMAWDDFVAENAVRANEVLEGMKP